MNSAQLSAPIFNSLKRRNFFIGFLRIIIPLLGLLLLGFLSLKIFLDNLGTDFDMSGIRIKSDKVIIDNPQYSGVMGNGTQYSINSKTATTPIAGSDEIDIFENELNLLRPDNYQMRAISKNAIFNMVAQTIDIKGLLQTSDSNNMFADLYNSKIDWVAQTLTTKDKAIIEFEDGSVLTSETLVYDAQKEIWDFTKVRLVIPIIEEEQ
ncbi:MAG: hypothetical protein L3J15_03250 [Devosiaceae bacterium]|nr:hypothetical protein [Devosiaceae bacterium]